MLPMNETTFHTQMRSFYPKGNTTVHLHKLIQTIYAFDNGKPHTDCLLLVYILEFFMLACNTALAVKGLTWPLNKWLYKCCAVILDCFGKETCCVRIQKLLIFQSKIFMPISFNRETLCRATER